jgi:hypothetical protein
MIGEGKLGKGEERRGGVGGRCNDAKYASD